MTYQQKRKELCAAQSSWPADSGLVARIGLDAIEALESDNAPKKWTREELISIRDAYRKKLKGHNEA